MTMIVTDLVCAAGLVLVSLSGMAFAEEASRPDDSAWREAIRAFVDAAEPEVRDRARARLDGFEDQVAARFTELIGLDERLLPEESARVGFEYPVDDLTGYAEVDVPARSSLAEGGPDSVPLLVVLLPSELDDAVASAECAAILGTDFVASGWVVAQAFPMALDPELTFRRDRSRPAHLRWTGGSGELVPWLVAKLLRELPIDPDRVVLAGFGEGADGALWVASRYADRFAAVVSIDGRFVGRHPARWVSNLRGLPVVTATGFVERTELGGAPQPIAQLLASVRAEVIDLDPLLQPPRPTPADPTPVPALAAEKPPAADFPETLRQSLTGMKRHVHDRVVRWFTDRPGYGACQWVEITACGDTAILEIEADPATGIHLIRRADDIRSLVIYAEPRNLPTGRTLTLEHAGRSTELEPRGPALDVLLDLWRRLGDPTRLYPTAYEFTLAPR